MNDKIAEKFKKVLSDDSFDISGKKQDGLNISPVTEPEIKSILVATPMYGGMCTGHYTIALMNSINTLREMKVETLLASVMNESLIPRARNELARLFLDQTKCSHLMFVDSDMYFDEKAIASLYNADKDVACGILNLPHGVEKAEPDADGMVEVRHGGTGFMLIKREVFEKLAPHVPEYRSSTKQNADGGFDKPLTRQFFDTSIDETGCLLSEDYHFCALWRKHGGKVYASTKIKFNHIGTHIFGGDIQ
jgi:hypothetical protein